MAFQQDTKDIINEYVWAHIHDESWHFSFFDFTDNVPLAARLGEEFISARYFYKILEGMEATNCLLRAQIRLQVLSYASIYEASLHHILFENLATDPKVIALTEFPVKKRISIPSDKLLALEKYLEHDGKRLFLLTKVLDGQTKPKSALTERQNALSILESLKIGYAMSL